MRYSYHKRLKFRRTLAEIARELWQAFMDAAHRWYIEDFAEWMDRR